MPLEIERPTTWWEFTNSPEQDPEIVAAEAFLLSGQMIPLEMFAEAIYRDHDAILANTADALGMEISLFMKAALNKQIWWQAPLLGKWVLAKSTERGWMPVPGVHASVMTIAR